VWAGILVSVGLLVGLKCFTPIHSLLFGFVGIMTVLLVASTLVKLPFRTDR
jgi:hypothetical protein